MASEVAQFYFLPSLMNCFRRDIPCGALHFYENDSYVTSEGRRKNIVQLIGTCRKRYLIFEDVPIEHSAVLYLSTFGQFENFA